MTTKKTKKETLPAMTSKGVWNKVKSKAEFELFVSWFEMLDETTTKQREAAYKKEDRESGGKGVASPEAKARVIARVAGEHIQKIARSANSLSGEALATGRSSDIESADAVCSDFSSMMTRLVSAVSEEICRNALLSCDALMTGTAASKLAEMAADRGKFGRTFVEMISSSEEDRIISSLESWKASSKGRSGIKGKAAPKKLSPSTENPGFYAPLLSYMIKNVEPSLRMEQMAAFEAYIRSGWASSDLISMRSSESDPARMERLSTWRDAMVSMRRTGVCDERVSAAMMDRIGDVLLQIKVVEKPVGTEKRHVVSKITVGSDPRCQSPSGCVDRAMVSARGDGVLYAFNVSSDEKTERQNDQWLAHLQAVSSFVRQNGKKTILGLPVSSLEYHVTTVSMIPQGQSPAKWGEAIARFYGKKSPLQLSPTLRDSFAMLPFLSCLAAPGEGKGFDMAEAAKIRWSMIGGDSSSWMSDMASAVESDDPRKALVGAMAKQWSLAVRSAVGEFDGGDTKAVDLASSSDMASIVKKIATMGAWLNEEHGIYKQDGVSCDSLALSLSEAAPSLKNISSKLKLGGTTEKLTFESLSREFAKIQQRKPKKTKPQTA